jgi:hypothetical protein
LALKSGGGSTGVSGAGGGDIDVFVGVSIGVMTAFGRVGKRAALGFSVAGVVKRFDGIVDDDPTFSLLILKRSSNAIERPDCDASAVACFSSSLFFLAAARAASFDGFAEPPNRPPRGNIRST